jgi:hypothetical protein
MSNRRKPPFRRLLAIRDRVQYYWRLWGRTLEMGTNPTARDNLESLSVYRHCSERVCAAWPGFLARRAARLEPHPLLGNTPEKITESILEDLFTNVLDWPIEGFNPQVEHTDIVLSYLGIRYLIIEAKRPGALAWNRNAVDRALEQAIRYADEQRVRRIAISDGVMLYAADIAGGGKTDRVFVRLGSAEVPLGLWWLSVQGIYRQREPSEGALLHLLQEEPIAVAVIPEAGDGEALLHPKYKLPARCFAYVGDHVKPQSWKLPYLNEDGTIDAKRLPKAIQCILSNYRGARVGGIPEQSIPAVLARLADAAARAGHLSPAASNPAPVYRQLADALKQLDITPEGE